MAILATNAVQIARFANALYGIQLGSVTNAAVLADITTAGGLDNALNSYYTSSFGSKTSAEVAAIVVANLGIVAGSNGLTAANVTDATNYVAANLNAAAASGRGAVIKNILNLWANGGSDATYGAAATAWNATVAAAQAYTASNTADAAVGAVVSGQTFTLTTGVDTGAAFVGTARDDTFNAADTTATTWTVGDAIDGGAGTDTFNVVRAAAIAAAPVGSSVKNVEIANITSGDTLSLSTTTWTGLTTLATNSVGGNKTTAAATTDVSITDTAMVTTTDSGITADGGKNVTLTLTAANATTDGDNTAEIVVGGTTAAAGAVAVNLTGKYAAGGNNTMSNIAVTGGTTVAVTTKVGLTAAQIAAEQAGTNDTTTQSAVSVTGNENTTAVTVTQDAAVVEVDTAGIGRVGIKNGAVTINDKNNGSTTLAGTIATATLNNYGDSTINSNALTTVNLSGAGGTLGITTNSLTTAVNTALALNVNGLSYKNAGTNNAITVDSDVKTLNIDSSTAASTVSNLTASGATTVNVSGNAKLTLTDNTFAAATSIVVTNTAGAVFGTTAIAAATSFKGGAGDDSIILSNAFSKAIDMGAGNDTVTYGGAASTTTGAAGSMSAGDGTDTIIMTTAQADAVDASSVFNASFTGFETLRVSDAHTTTVDLDGVNAVTKVVLAAGANGGTLTNLASGGTVDVLAEGAGNLTVNVKSALVSAADVLNVNLLNTSAMANARTVTAANVETVNIGVADAAAAPAVASDAVTHTLTLAATSAKTITVTGNNGLTLTNTGNTAVTLFDASGVVANSTAATKTAAATSDTAANLAVTFASANTTSTANVTIKGGAGDDVLSGTVAKDTISGNAGADRIYSDNAGTKEVQRVAITYVASETDVFTVLGVDVSFATGADQAAAAANLTAAINGKAELKGLVLAVNDHANNAGRVNLNFLVDGDQIASVDKTSAANTNAVSEVTPGTAGTSAVDSLDGGAGADLLVGGGGADTITTGSGADRVFFLKAHSNAATLTTITDFTYAVGGSSNDTIILGDVATAVGTVTTVQDLSSSASLTAALNAAALANAVDNGLSVFIYGGDTYAYVETTGATGTYQAADFVVKLTGTPLAAGATIAGTGFDAV